jgi:hypothetical protein
MVVFCYTVAKLLQKHKHWCFDSALCKKQNKKTRRYVTKRRGKAHHKSNYSLLWMAECFLFSYIQYETNLLELVRMRRETAGYQHKKGKSQAFAWVPTSRYCGSRSLATTGYQHKKGKIQAFSWVPTSRYGIADPGAYSNNRIST